jgi:hypothetical protein
MKSRKMAAIFAYVGGTLLLIAGATGSTGIIGTIIEYLIENLGGATANLLSLILQTLNFIADLGGISVIIGGLFIINQRTRIGKFIIGIGAGMGLVGFLIILASAFLHGWINIINFVTIIAQSIGWIGIILSITAIILAK